VESKASNMNFRFRHLAGVTTGLTFGLILLGVYTGAIGAGLACAGRWPFCDGWLGLFPAHWPSFVEWFHRLVAMVSGFFILGTAYAAWRHDHERRIQIASAIAVVVLPIQVLLGANTIVNFGVEAQMLHHAAAQLIFGALVAATAWAFDEGDAAATAESEADSGAAAAGADD
jgi:cytochrome c oxidase assembly protein subunit 15